MSDLKDQVREFVAFDAIAEYDNCVEWTGESAYQDVGDHENFHRHGAKFENSRLAPLLELLPEVVECLENIEPKLMELAKVLKNNAKSKEQGIAEHDACLIAIGYLKAALSYQQTLAKIKEAVGKP